MHTSWIYVSLFDYCPEGKIPLQGQSILIKNNQNKVMKYLIWLLYLCVMWPLTDLRNHKYMLNMLLTYSNINLKSQG